MQSGQAPTRKVSLLLIIGIIFLPIIFVWFLLRKGYSTTARVIGFGWLVLSFILATSGSKNEPRPVASEPTAQHQTVPAEPEPQAPPAEVAMEVTARDLAAAYDANEVAADQKFKGKTVLISGRVESVDSGPFDSPIVSLAGGGEFGERQVWMYDVSKESAASLSKGQSIKALCKATGESMSFPTLSKCVLQ